MRFHHRDPRAEEAVALGQFAGAGIAPLRRQRAHPRLFQVHRHLDRAIADAADDLGIRLQRALDAVCIGAGMELDDALGRSHIRQVLLGDGLGEAAVGVAAVADGIGRVAEHHCGPGLVVLRIRLHLRTSGGDAKWSPWTGRPEFKGWNC